MSRHFLSPSLAMVPTPGQGGEGNFGMRAIAPIAAGAVLAVWGGRIVTTAELLRLDPEIQEFVIQVEEDLFSLPAEPPEPADYFNHSCAPNAGINGQIALIAMRAIKSGEDVAYDYAMTDSHPIFTFLCGCGAPNCRGRVTGDDWRLPALQARYAGYFSTYLARRIAADALFPTIPAPTIPADDRATA